MTCLLLLFRLKREDFLIKFIFFTRSFFCWKNAFQREVKSVIRQCAEITSIMQIFSFDFPGAARQEATGECRIRLNNLTLSIVPLIQSLLAHNFIHGDGIISYLSAEHFSLSYRSLVRYQIAL